MIGAASAVDVGEGEAPCDDSGITEGLAAAVHDAGCRGAWSRTASRAVEDPAIRGTCSTCVCDKGLGEEEDGVERESKGAPRPSSYSGPGDGEVLTGAT